jgi:hypothetical protein
MVDSKMFMKFATHFPKIVSELRVEGILSLSKALKNGEGIYFEDVIKKVPFWNIKANSKFTLVNITSPRDKDSKLESGVI